MSPRLVALALVLLSLCGALVLLVRYAPIDDSSNGARRDPEVDEPDAAPEIIAAWGRLPANLRPPMAADLEQRAGVVLLSAVAPFTAGRDKVSGMAPAAGETWPTALAVVEELQRYPTSYLVAARLRLVILTHTVRMAGREWGGLASPRDQALFLSTESSPDFRRHALHHEVYHLFDRFRFDEAKWGALNPPGFTYDPKQALIPAPGVGTGIDRVLYGFITRYAMFSADEDRAETFSWLMSDYKTSADVASHDQLLAAKIDRVKHDVVARAPEMSDAFWAGIAVGR